MRAAEKGVRAAVRAGVFDEDAWNRLRSVVERAGVRSAKTGELLAALTPASFAAELEQDGTSSEVLFVYLARLARILDGHPLTLWHDVLVERLAKSRGLRQADKLLDLCAAMLATDGGFCTALLRRYCSEIARGANMSASLLQEALVAHAESNGRRMFALLARWAMNEQTAAGALHLLAVVVHRDGPSVCEVMETPLFAAVVRSCDYRTTRSVDAVITALWVLNMMLPSVVGQMVHHARILFVIVRGLHRPSALGNKETWWRPVAGQEQAEGDADGTALLAGDNDDDIVDPDAPVAKSKSKPKEATPVRSPLGGRRTIGRASDGDASEDDTDADAEFMQNELRTNRELRRCVTEYFRLLCALFPINFVRYLRAETTRDPDLREFLNPWTKRLVISGDVLLTAEREIDPNRWKTVDVPKLLASLMEPYERSGTGRRTLRSAVPGWLEA